MTEFENLRLEWRRAHLGMPSDAVDGVPHDTACPHHPCSHLCPVYRYLGTFDRRMKLMDLCTARSDSKCLLMTCEARTQGQARRRTSRNVDACDTTDPDDSRFASARSKRWRCESGGIGTEIGGLLRSWRNIYGRSADVPRGRRTGIRAGEDRHAKLDIKDKYGYLHHSKCTDAVSDPSVGLMAKKNIYLQCSHPRATKHRLTDWANN